MDNKIQRRLAAIMSVDMVDYSRFVGLDETGVIERFNTLRAELFDPVVSHHDGRIVKALGDGFLIEFSSAVNAVNSAVELQSQLAKTNADAPIDTRMHFRIGINLGEIIVRDGDIFGDAVNISARLEGIAVSGGVCISEKVGVEVLGKIDFKFQHGGEYTVKNIVQPVSVLHWHPDKLKVLPVGRMEADGDNKPGRKPAVMIIALDIYGGGDDVENFAAILDDEIAGAFANLTGITLVSAVDEANYIVKGSLRAVGTRFRATMQLNDKIAQDRFWSEHFNGDLQDIFDDMSELAARICSAVRYEIYERETEKTKHLPIEMQSSQELMGQAGSILFHSRRANYERSKKLISTVVKRDPNNAMALAISSWGRTMIEVICGYGPITPKDGEVGGRQIRRSIELNERSDFAHMVQGNVHLHWEQDISAAILEAERCLELTKGYVLALSMMGQAFSFSGDPVAGIKYCNKAAETDARFPAIHWIMEDIALGNFVQQDYQAAVDWAQRAERRQPGVARILLMLATSAAHAGQTELANKTIDRLCSSYPGIHVAGLRCWPFQDPADWNRFTGGLIEAGLST